MEFLTTGAGSTGCTHLRPIPLHYNTWVEAVTTNRQQSELLQKMQRPANCQLEAHLHMGLIEDNKTSSPLRQHGMFLKWKLSPQTRGTSAIHQINHPKMPSNCLLCSVYLMALLNCCCSFQSWVWHEFSIWFTAMLKLNSSLRFLNINLYALESIFQRHFECHYVIYSPKRKSQAYAF